MSRISRSKKTHQAASLTAGAARNRRRYTALGAFLGLGMLIAACGGHQRCGGQQPIPTPVNGQLERPVQLTMKLDGNALHVEVMDEGKPVRTDLWLYTLEGDALKPLQGFKDTDSKRKDRNLLLPATIKGAPSGLAPANDGGKNGLMTDIARTDTNGKVSIVFDAMPSNIVLVVGREDQRYSGAALVDPSGKLRLPKGLGERQAITPKSFVKDIAPILSANCTGCHRAGASVSGFPLSSWDDLVTYDFGRAEHVEECNEKNATDTKARDACIRAITASEFMVEPGAPSLSPLLRRTRPDEEGGASANGLAWFGRAGSRFGEHGDRRMPPSNTTKEESDDKASISTHFDLHPADYQVLFDWVAQGAPR